jgi:hypothetical protein
VNVNQTDPLVRTARAYCGHRIPFVAKHISFRFLAAAEISFIEYPQTVKELACKSSKRVDLKHDSSMWPKIMNTR